MKPCSENLKKRFIGIEKTTLMDNRKHKLDDPSTIFAIVQQRPFDRTLFIYLFLRISEHEIHQNQRDA